MCWRLLQHADVWFGLVDILLKSVEFMRIIKSPIENIMQRELKLQVKTFILELLAVWLSAAALKENHLAKVLSKIKGPLAFEK